MTEPFPGPATSTFVIRFLREWSPAGRPRWRGRIEHIPSGKSAAFLDQEVMWEFIQSFGIIVDDPDQSETEDGSSPSSHRPGPCLRPSCSPKKGGDHLRESGGRS